MCALPLLSLADDLFVEFLANEGGKARVLRFRRPICVQNWLVCRVHEAPGHVSEYWNIGIVVCQSSG